MKTEQLQIRISPELKEQLKKTATKEGQTVSEWLTDLIKKEIWKRSQ